MSTKTASARPGHDRASLYDEITGKIIAELETGRAPWAQPWGTATAKVPLAMPRNAATGRHYSGINVLILWGALQMAELLADLDILFMEEPTHYNGTEAHLKVSSRSPIPIATGEKLYTRWGFLPYLQAGAIDMIQPDMGLVGGLSEGMKIAHLAQAFDVGIQAHICGSPLATAIALQFEASIPNFEIHEHHSYTLKSCNRDLFEQDLQRVNERLAIPTVPGFGMTLREDAEKRMDIAKVSFA